MTKKAKLKKLISKLTTLDPVVADTFKSLDEEMAKISTKLKENYTEKTLTQVDGEFKKLQSSFDSLPTAINKIYDGLDSIHNSLSENLSSELSSKYEEFINLVEEKKKESISASSQSDSKTNERINALKKVIEKLGNELLVANKTQSGSMPVIRKEISNSIGEVKNLIDKVKQEITRNSIAFEKENIATKEEFKKLLDLIEKARQEFNNRIASHGGGNQNRGILVDGTNYFKRYTDVNFVAGNNVTLGVTNDDDLHTTNITINSTGGGGGGGSEYFIDQTPDDGTYGALSGTVNGINTTFTVSEGEYLTGKLVVYRNGLLQLQGTTDDWSETSPASGTFDFVVAPLVGDKITAYYTTAVASATGHVIEEEGTPLTQRTYLNFVGAGVTATDDVANDATVITVTGVPAGSTSWGSIIGTLSNQSDLQTALNAKLNGTGTTNYIPYYLNASTLGATQIAPNQLMGMSSVGVISAISLGTNLSITGSVLNATGGGTISGTDTQVLFFDGTDNPAGDAGFTYNKNTSTLSVTGQISAGTDGSMTINGTPVISTIQANSDTQAIIETHTFSATAGAAAVYYGGRSRGTTASPAIVQNGDFVRSDIAVAFDGTDYEIGGFTNWSIDGTPGANDMPMKWAVWTTRDGTNVSTERMTVNNNGVVNISGLTASRVITTDISKNLTPSTTTDTELGYLGGVTSSVVSINNTQTLANKTLVTPSIASFAQAQHNHQNGAGGGLLNGSSVFSMTGGQIKTSVLGTGTANNTTYLRGDSTWASVSATPAGANQQVQYNDAGAAGASSVFTWNKNASILTANRIASSVFTASRAVVTDGSSILAVSTTTATEIGHLGGVTSSVVSINNTQTLTNKSIVATQLTGTAYTYPVNNTSSTASMTLATHKHLVNQVLPEEDLTYTAGAAPSGAYNGTYCVFHEDRQCTVTVNINHATDGTTVSNLLIAWQANWPDPLEPTGFTAGGANLYQARLNASNGVGGSSTGGNNGFVRRNAGDTAYEVNLPIASGTYDTFLTGFTFATAT